MKLYHLSFKDLGKEVTLKISSSEERSDTEIDTSRISASPSIEGCIIALKGCERFKNEKKENTLCLHVYEIIEPKNFHPYREVFDFIKTNEHISFKNENAKKIGIIHIPYSKGARYLNNPISVEDANCVYEFISEDVFEKYYKTI